MSKPTRIASQGTFFTTAITEGRRTLFQVDRNAQLFLDTLQHYRSQGHYKLFDFVVMPDHVHLILTPQGITLQRALQFIKGGFSHRLASNLPVWQRSFADHLIRDREDFLQHRVYLRDNPVRARLCQRPEDYKWSSAYRAPSAEFPMPGSLSHTD